MRLQIFNLFLGSVLVLSLASCDSGNGDDNGGSDNPFEASITVSGDAEASFSGSAAFAEDDDADGGYLIFIYEGEFSLVPSGTIVAINHDTASPAEGTFAFDDDGFEGTYASELSNIFTGTVVSSESGQLTITSLSGDRLSGSFSFTGEVVSGGEVQGTATVQGTFTADHFAPGEIPGFF